MLISPFSYLAISACSILHFAANILSEKVPAFPERLKVKAKSDKILFLNFPCHHSMGTAEKLLVLDKNNAVY